MQQASGGSHISESSNSTIRGNTLNNVQLPQYYETPIQWHLHQAPIQNTQSQQIPTQYIYIRNSHTIHSTYNHNNL